MNNNQQAVLVPPSDLIGAEQDIRGLKPLMEIPGEWTWLWCTLLLIAALIGLAYYIRYRRAHLIRTPPVKPRIPPHIRAREKLKEALRFIDHPKKFCTLTSDPIRTYLEERFDLRAPERTTEEFLEELKYSESLNAIQKERMKDFLSLCDLVKFAKFEPTQTELRHLHQSAMNFVDEMELTTMTHPGHPNLEKLTVDKAS